MPCVLIPNKCLVTKRKLSHVWTFSTSIQIAHSVREWCKKKSRRGRVHAFNFIWRRIQRRTIEFMRNSSPKRKQYVVFVLFCSLLCTLCWLGSLDDNNATWTAREHPYNLCESGLFQYIIWHFDCTESEKMLYSLTERPPPARRRCERTMIPVSIHFGVCVFLMRCTRYLTLRLYAGHRPARASNEPITHARKRHKCDFSCNVTMK